MTSCYFDKAELYEAFTDIETYLGYLKGNELAYDYLLRARTELSREERDGETTFAVGLDFDYLFPCPERRWAVSPDGNVRQFAVTTVVDRGSDVDPGVGVVRQLQAYADEAWHDGASWASGLGSYLFSLCERFVEPDAPAMGAAIIDLQKEVLAELDEGSKPDWADIGHSLDNWSGESADAFSTFYDDYAWYKATWGNYASHAVTGLIVATRIIDQTQRGVMEYADSMRRALRDQLDLWMSFRRPPEDPPRTPAWVAKVESIAGHAYELLKAVPAIGEVAEKGEKIVSVAGTVKDLAVDVGVPIPDHDERQVPVRTADELYTELTRTLRDDYDRAYWAALEKLYDGPGYGPEAGQGFSGQLVLGNLRQLVADGDWMPHPSSRDSAYDPQDDRQYG